MLHLIVALLVFWLSLILFKDELLSFFAGLLYVIHPIHTEAVAYISGRTDPLAALFTLAALIFYIKSFEKRKVLFFLLMMASYALALLSREQSLIFPALMLVYYYAFKKKGGLVPFGAAIVISILYLVLRYSVLGFVLSKAASYATIVERVPGFFAALAEYVRFMVLPLGMHMAYGHKAFSFADPQAVLGIMIFIGLITFAAKAKREDRLPLFSIAWFLVALIPVASIFPPLSAFMAIHWLYLPSIGLFLLAGKALAVLYRSGKARTASLATLACLVIFYSSITIEQNNYWSNPAAFFERTLKYAPDSYSWKLYFHLADERVKAGNPKDAILLYRKALALNGQFADAYNNLGKAYAETGDSQRAITAYRKALWVDPAFGPAYKNLSEIYRRLGRSNMAAKYSDLASKFKR